MITITTDGLLFHLRFPYSPRVIALVRSIDGRKWNPTAKRWEVAASPGAADWIDRTLAEVGYVADDQFHAHLEAHRQAQAVVARAVQTERATCTTCFDHQKVGLNLSLAREAFVLAWEMGCVAARTSIMVENSSGRFGTMDVVDAFLSPREKRERVFALCGTKLGYHGLKTAICKGIRPCAKLTTLRRTLVATPDHEIMAANGSWVALSSLRPGDSVMIHKGGEDLDADTVISVEPAGMTDVYDLVMDEPYHTFVANGIVVHNCGKSKTAVDLAGISGCGKVLIACPKSVVPSWYHQFMTHGRCYGIQCVLLREGSVEKRARMAEAALARGPTALVVNYEALIRAPLNEWALAQQWDLVIADEIHRLARGKSKTSKFFDKLRPQARRRLGLTGTPMPNTPMDVWAQMRFIDPGLFGTSFYAFRNRYARLGGFQDKQVVAFKNLEELSERFYSAAHRVTKEQCLDLPEYTDVTIEADLGKKAAKAYETIEGQFVAHLEEGSITLSNAFVEILRLQQLTGGAVQYDEKEAPVEIDTAKHDALVDILSDLPSDDPVVVFCRFHHDVDACFAAAKGVGRGCHELSGRANALEQWQRSDGGEVLATQIQSGGLGVDMTRARYCVFYSLGYSLAEYEQARARLHRQGQTRNVTYYHLLGMRGGKKTVDHQVYKALTRKEKVVESVLKSIRG